MRTRWILTLAAVAISSAAMVQAPRHLNPVVDLLSQKKAVFGLYAPANRRGRGGASPADAPPPKTPTQLAGDALAQSNADYIFDGTMEGDFDRGFASFTEFMKGMAAGGMLKTSPMKVLHQPLFVKTHEIAPDPALAMQRIARQLNLGVTGIVLVDVKSAEEAKAGIAAMRFKSQGGTRPDDVGTAPSVWGMSESEYRQKADVWPLNPNGELVNFTIVESKEGLARVRDIAAVKGVGVLFPGAGTLSGLFGCRGNADPTTEGCVAWEKSIQQVLAACKEFNVPCGYPANDSTMMVRRMKEGFTVFITAWGENGFKAVEVGKRAGGR